VLVVNLDINRYNFSRVEKWDRPVTSVLHVIFRALSNKNVKVRFHHGKQIHKEKIPCLK